VRKVFKAAVADRVISQDPCIDVALPSRPRRAAAMRVPTTSEVGRLLGAADEDFATFIALCAFAGLRLGEAAALQLGDVDFPRRVLAVRRQVQRLGGGEVELRAPKYGSIRDVPLSDGLVAIVSTHVARRGLHAGSDRDSFIFANDGGTPPHQNTVGHRWRQTLKAAGVDNIKLHDLRHFYASGLIHDGCDVVTVQNALGHARPTTTLNTYAHLWPTAEDRTRNSSAKLLQQALNEVNDASGGAAIHR
jgi:integrase